MEAHGERNAGRIGAECRGPRRTVHARDDWGAPSLSGQALILGVGVKNYPLGDLTLHNTVACAG